MLLRGAFVLGRISTTPQFLSSLSTVSFSSSSPASQEDSLSSSFLSFSRQRKWEPLNQKLQQWQQENPHQPLPELSQQALLFALSSPSLSPSLRATFSTTLSPPSPSPSSLPPLPSSSSSEALRDTLQSLETMESRDVHASVKNWMKVPGLLRESNDPQLSRYAATLFTKHPPPDVDVSGFTAMMNAFRQIHAYDEGLLVYKAADAFLDRREATCGEEDELRLRTTAINILGWLPPLHSHPPTTSPSSLPLSPFDVYKKMVSRGVKPDIRVMNILLHLCERGEGGRERLGELVEEMKRLELLPTPKTLDALLSHVFERVDDLGESFDEKVNMAEEYVNMYCSMTGKDEQGFVQECSEFSLLVLAHNYLPASPPKASLFANELLRRFTTNPTPSSSFSSHPQTHKEHYHSLLDLMCRLHCFEEATKLLENISHDSAPHEFDKIVTNSLKDYLSYLQKNQKPEQFLTLVSLVSSVSPSYLLTSHRRYLYQIIGEKIKEGGNGHSLCVSLGVTQPIFFEMLFLLGRAGDEEGLNSVLSIMEKMGIDAGVEGQNAQIQVKLSLQIDGQVLSLLENLEIPHVSTFNLVLRHLNQKSDIDQMFKVYRKMEAEGISPDIATYSLMTDILLKKERTDEVFEFVQKMRDDCGVVSSPSSPSFPDLSSSTYDPRNAGACYNTLIELYGKEGNVEGVMRLLHQMSSESSLREQDRINKFVAPSSLTYTSLLKTLSASSRDALPSFLSQLERLTHPHSTPSYTPDASLCWRLTHTFVTNKDLKNAQRSLDLLRTSRGFRTEHLLTDGVVGLVKLLKSEAREETGKELMREIVSEFRKLLLGGEVRPVGKVGSGVLVNNLVGGVVDCGLVEEAEGLYRTLEKNWYQSLGEETKSGLLKIFFKEKKWDLVDGLLKREKEERSGGMGEGMRNTMVGLLCESGEYEVAEQLLAESKQFPLPFSLFHSLLSQPTSNKAFSPLPLLHNLSKQNTPLKMVVSPETIAFIIGNLGGKGKGRHKNDIFQFYKYGMRTGSQVPRSLFERMIHVCCQNYAHPQAIRALKEMEEQGHRPDTALYHTIIKSLGKRAGEYAMVNGFRLYRAAVSSHLNGFPSPATLSSLEALCLHQKSIPYASLLKAELDRLSLPSSPQLAYLAGGGKGKKEEKERREGKAREKERERKFDYASQNRVLREKKTWLGPPK